MTSSLGRRPASLATTIVAASFGFALVQLDVTIVNVALPAMAQALHTDIAGLQWVVDAYALAFAALLLSAGHLGDRVGARRVFLGGLLVFGVASLACGVAPTSAVLVAGRALQGVGAAAMLPCSLALLDHAAAGDAGRRATAIGWWAAAGSIAIAAGPIVGGLILGVASWRFVFLVNLPVCVVGAILAARADETDRQATGGFDVAGQILAVLALSGLVGAVIEAKPQGVGSPVVWGAAAIGVAAAWGFLRVESRGRAPMLPISLFRDPTVRITVLYGVAANLAFYGTLFILSFYLQRVLGYGPVATGLAYLPLTATLFVANLIAGRLVGRVGSRMPMVVGAVFAAAGFALLLGLGKTGPFALLPPAFGLIAFGVGLGIPAMIAALLGSVARERSGLASGVLNAARQAAGAVGVALFGALAADDVVAGLHHSAMISVALLGAVAALAVTVRPAHADASS